MIESVNVGSVEQLSRDSEIMLFGQVQEGKEALFVKTACNALRGLLGYEPGTCPEIEEKIELGNVAREIVILSNKGLVLKVVLENRDKGLPISDLFQEGVIGLMRAVEKFDATRNFRFSTYATPWVENSIKRAIQDNSRTIRVPQKVSENADTISYETAQAQQQSHGVKPDRDEIAQKLGISEGQAKRTRFIRSTVSLSQTQIRGDGSESDELSDKIPGFDNTEEEALELQHSIDLLNRANLSEDYKEIVMLRDVDGLTFKDIGKKFGCTRQNIQYKYLIAMRKLRAAKG